MGLTNYVDDVGCAGISGTRSISCGKQRGREGGMWECERESVDLGWVPPGHQLGYEMHEDKQCHIHFPHHWVSAVVPAERERVFMGERDC